MTTISARIVEDTKAPSGARLTTMSLRYPRAIHAELMTHRVFSRSSSSSRAIPTRKALDLILEDPFTPVHWGKNQRGMQAREELEPARIEDAKTTWLAACRLAVNASRDLLEIGVHKQIANRVAEPFSHISVVVTSTEWSNFFGLRADKDAQPEMQELGWAMADAYYSSVPRRLDDIVLGGDLMKRPARHWHLPYTSLEERTEIGLEAALVASTARCARVSYMNHEGRKPSLEEDSELHEILFNQRHMSPFEHQGTPARSRDYKSRNFSGWVQYRATVPNDTREFNYLEACKRAGREPVLDRVEWWKQ